MSVGPTDMSLYMLRPEDVSIYIDAGANIGGYVSAHAPFVDEIHAFEPFPWVLDQLRATAEAVQEQTGTRVFVNPVGLSDREADLDNVKVYEAWTLANEDLKHGLHEEYPPFSMHLTTLDHYVEEQQLASVDFMKVDVDGYELRLIKGALRCIEKHKPSMLLEISHLPNLLGDSNEELGRIIFDLGYRVFYSVGPRAPDELEFKTLEDLMSCPFWRSSGDVALIHKDKSHFLEVER